MPKMIAQSSDTQTQQLLNELNRLRRDAGVTPLTVHPLLAQVAQTQANYMASSGQYTSYGADGSDLRTRVQRAGYILHNGWLGESWGGVSSFDQIVATWVSADIQRSTLLNAQYNEVGIGLAQGSQIMYMIVLAANPNAPAQNAPAQNTPVPNTPTATIVPTATPSPTRLPTSTQTPASTSTQTPVSTSTQTSTPSPTRTPVPSPTQTLSLTLSATRVPTLSVIITPTSTRESTLPPRRTSTTAPTVTNQNSITLTVAPTPQLTIRATVIQSLIISRNVDEIEVNTLSPLPLLTRLQSSDVVTSTTPVLLAPVPSTPVPSTPVPPESSVTIDNRQTPFAQSTTLSQAVSLDPITTQRQTMAHTVQSGETLTSIALRYRVDWKVLAEMNGILNPNRLSVDQVLIIPVDEAVIVPTRRIRSMVVPDLPSKPIAPRTTPGPSETSMPSSSTFYYMIQPGDTIYSIAETLKMDLDELLYVNDLTITSVITPGQRLQYIFNTRDTDALTDTQSLTNTQELTNTQTVTDIE